MHVELSALDQGIIIFYFLTIAGVGLAMSRLASKGIDNYFLGGKKIPW